MKTVAVVGTQWGDEGKGKIVDLLAADADVVVRFQGGNNAAHTLVVDGEKFILRLIPAGALHPGKVCVIGNGTVVDPLRSIEEIDGAARRADASLDASLLKLSCDAHMVMPYHRAIDRAREARARQARDRHHRLRHRSGLRGQDGAHGPALRRPHQLRAFKEKLERNARGQKSST